MFGLRFRHVRQGCHSKQVHFSAGKARLRSADPPQRRRSPTAGRLDTPAAPQSLCRRGRQCRRSLRRALWLLLQTFRRLRRAVVIAQRSFRSSSVAGGFNGAQYGHALRRFPSQPVGQRGARRAGVRAGRAGPVAGKARSRAAYRRAMGARTATTRPRALPYAAK